MGAIAEFWVSRPAIEVFYILSCQLCALRRAFGALGAHRDMASHACADSVDPVAKERCLPATTHVREQIRKRAPLKSEHDRKSDK